jgi:hypothetical protein
VAPERQIRFYGDDATNATMEIATFTRLATTVGLIEHLEDAVASKNLALAEAVRLEFQGRSDREGVKDRFAAAFAEVPLPQSMAAIKTIGSINSLAGSVTSGSIHRSVVGPIPSLAWRRLGSLRLKRITRCDGWANTYSGAGRQQRASPRVANAQLCQRH